MMVVRIQVSQSIFVVTTKDATYRLSVKLSRKFRSISSIVWGMVPCNLLLMASIVSSEVINPISVGISPEKEFELMSRLQRMVVGVKSAPKVRKVVFEQANTITSS